MGKKVKYAKTMGAGSIDGTTLKHQLAFLRKNKQKFKDNYELYYNQQEDLQDVKLYYKGIGSFNIGGKRLFYAFHELLKKTHKNRVPYFISKDLFLYTWVDLYPDGTVKSIYSGHKKDPEDLIIEDNEIIRKRYEEYTNHLQKVKKNEYEVLKELKSIEWKLKVNTEHIVPQSWFSSLEPMKGDLHHLFVCQPQCNMARSNFPYADFIFYEPGSPHEPIRNNCGVKFDSRFEPEYGKGEAARAMLYFFIRYPRAIKKAFRMEIDVPLLIRWHKEFEVTLHEKHRNQSIYRIQGNRNPFIDFPELVDKIDFPTIP